MRITNSYETYGLVHQLLHWATALLILVLLPMGVYMHDLPDATPQQVDDKFWLYSLHKTIGMTAFVIAIARIVWAIAQPHPRPLHGGMEGFAAKTVHFLLYGTIIAMPLLGWFHHAASQGFAPIWWPFSQNLFFIPKNVDLSNFFKTAHFVTGVLLVISLFLHIAGAIKHTVIDKDKTLSRMVPGAYDETGTPPMEQPKSPLALYAALAASFIAVAATFGVYSIKHGSTAQVASTSGAQTAPVSDGAWIINYETSKLEIIVDQVGTPITGSFADWSADVIFDPDAPENARINALVQVGSLSLGEVTDQATSSDFLGVEANPTALFTSENVSKTDSGYAAQGIMTLGGIEQDFTINFTFDEQDGKANVSGEGVIQRLDFGIGQQYQDDSTVGRAIKLMLTIEATRG